MKIVGNQVQTTIYLMVEQAKGLKKLSKKTRVPISEYIREGCDYILKKYKGAK